MVAADFADWWDKQLKTTDQELNQKFMKQWAAENPQWFDYAVSVAAVSTVKGVQGGLNASTMNFADGFIDVLRLGAGAGEGGFWNWGRDILRLLSVIPAGKVPLGQARKAIGFKNMKVIVDPGGPICSWMSASQALRQTGVKLLAGVDDLAKAAGLNARGASIPGRWADQLVPVLRKLGADVKVLAKPNSLEDVTNAAKRHDGVVLFAIKWMRKGKEVYHTIYAFRNPRGVVQFADRNGRVVDKIADLGKAIPGKRKYTGIEGATVHTGNKRGAMILVTGAKMTVMEMAGYSAAILALPIDRLRVLIANPGEEQKIKQSFMEFKLRRNGNNWTVSQTNLPPVSYLTGVRARLMYLGYYNGPIPGEYDPVTRQAVIAFQRAHPPLRADGIPGPKTQARLQQEFGG